MDYEKRGGIVEIIGREYFEWLSEKFKRETKLKDVPDEILSRISLADVAIRDFSQDLNAITAIALITFAYRIGGKIQNPRHGTNDILLLKVLAKNERSRREDNRICQEEFWDLPLFELISGEVGDRIRATKFITNPV